MFKVILTILNLTWVTFAFNEISSDTLNQWLKGFAPSKFILIDLREISEITTVIGSENCGPYNFPFNSGVFDKKVNSFPRDTVIVLYCRSGSRSGSAAKKCDTLGFTKVYSLKGGITSWKGLVLQSDQIKPETVFPQIQCVSQVSILPHKSFKSPGLWASPSNKNINLQGKICSSVAPGLLITFDKPVMIVKSKKR